LKRKIQTEGKRKGVPFGTKGYSGKGNWGRNVSLRVGTFSQKKSVEERRQHLRRMKIEEEKGGFGSKRR